MPFQSVAFLSYSRKDEPVAARLQRDLERFRIPTAIERPAGLPGDGRHVRPVVRDRTDLDVSEQPFIDDIKSQLDRSRSLIVLCSPDSANSQYVNHEILHFLASRPDAAAHVVPVILSGNPTAPPNAGGCFPPALSDLGPAFVARNHPTFVQATREQVVLQTVARLLGVSYVTLHDRHLARKRRTLRIIAATASTIAAVFIVLSIFAFSQRSQAIAQRAQAVEARNRAELRLAESLVATGESQATLGDELGARQSLIESLDAFQSAGSDAINAEMALTLSFARQPHSLLTIGQDDPTPAALAISASARSLATIDDAGRIRIRDIKTGALRSTLQTSPTREVKAPNGNAIPRANLLRDSHLAVLEAHDIVLTLVRLEGLAAWDSRSGKLLRTFEDADAPQGLHVSADQSLLVFAAGKKILRFRLPAFEPLPPIDMPADSWCLSVSPDARAAAVGTAHGFALADLTLGIYRHQQLTDWVMGCAAAPRGELVLTADHAGAVKVWDLLHPARSQTLLPHVEPTDLVSLSPDATWAFAHTGIQTTTGWLLRDPKKQRKILGTQFTLSPDGSFAVTCLDGHAKVWNLTDHDPNAVTIDTHSLCPASTLSSDARLAFCMTEQDPESLHVYDAQSGLHLQEFPKFNATSAALFTTSSPTTLLRVASLKNHASPQIQHVDIQSGKVTSQWELEGWFHGLTDPAVAYSPATNLLLFGFTRPQYGARKATLEGYDAATGSKRFSLDLDNAFAIALSRDGTLAAAAGARNILLVDAKSGAVLRRLEWEDKHAITSLDFSTDSLILGAHSSTPSPTLFSWDTRTGELLQQVPAARDERSSIHAIGGKNAPFLAADERGTRCWDLNNAVLLRTLPDADRNFRGMISSTNDARHVLVGDIALTHYDFSRARQYLAWTPRLTDAAHKLESAPDDPAALAELGRWYTFVGRSDWAIELLTAAQTAGAAIEPQVLAHARMLVAGADPSTPTGPDSALAKAWQSVASTTLDPAERIHAALCATYTPAPLTHAPITEPAPPQNDAPLTIHGGREAYRLTLPPDWTPSVEHLLPQIDVCFVRNDEQLFQVLTFPLPDTDAGAQNPVLTPAWLEQLAAGAGVTVDTMSVPCDRSVKNLNWICQFNNMHLADGTPFAAQYWMLRHDQRLFLLYFTLTHPTEDRLPDWDQSCLAVVESFIPPPILGSPALIHGRLQPYTFALDRRWTEETPSPGVDRTFSLDQSTYLFVSAGRPKVIPDRKTLLTRMQSMLNKDQTPSPDITVRYTSLEVRTQAGLEWAVATGTTRSPMITAPLTIQDWNLLSPDISFGFKLLYLPDSPSQAPALEALRTAIDTVNPGG